MAAKPNWQLLITIPKYRPDTKGKKEDMLYTVNIKTSDDQWSFERFYEDFKELDKIARCMRSYSIYWSHLAENLIDIGKFPPDKIGKKDENFLDSRRILLKNYLQKLAAPGNICISKAIRKWLELDDNVAADVNARAIAVVKVIGDYNASNADELTVTEGEILNVIDKLDGEWFKCKKANQVGLVYHTYLEIVAEMNETQVVSEVGGVKKARVLYDYDAEDDTQLSFRTGDILIMMEYSDPDWWRGKLNSVVGYFPSSYVEEVVEAKTRIKKKAPVKSARRSQQNLAPVKVAQEKTPPPLPPVDPNFNQRAIAVVSARCDYEAQKEGELTIHAKDLVMVTNKDDEFWWAGKCNGKFGWFPAEYCSDPVGGSEAIPETIPDASSFTVRVVYEIPNDQNILYVPVGSTLYVCGETDGYYEATYGNKTGWVPVECCQVVGDDENVDQVSNEITANVLYDYSDPSDSTMAAVYAGDVVVILSVDDEWTSIQTPDGSQGYVPSSYLSY